MLNPSDWGTSTNEDPKPNQQKTTTYQRGCRRPLNPTDSGLYDGQQAFLLGIRSICKAFPTWNKPATAVRRGLVDNVVFRGSIERHRIRRWARDLLWLRNSCGMRYARPGGFIEDYRTLFGIVWSVVTLLVLLPLYVS